MTASFGVCQVDGADWCYCYCR